MQDGKLILYDDNGGELVLANPLEAIHELLNEPPKDTARFIGNRHERRKQIALARKAKRERERSGQNAGN